MFLRYDSWKCVVRRFLNLRASLRLRYSMPELTVDDGTANRKRLKI